MDERSRVDRVRQVLDGHLGQLAETVIRFIDQGTQGGAAETLAGEQALRESALKVVVDAVRTALDQEDSTLRERLRARGHRTADGEACSGRLKSHGRKWKDVQAIFGEIRVKQWTAQCKRCGQWLGTVDELPHVVADMTPACANTVGIAGATMPYEPGRKSLLASAGLRVDDNRVKNLVDKLGPRAQQCFREAVAPSRRTLPPKGTIVYVLLDGGRIRFRAKGGERREPCLGLILWEPPEGTWIKHGISHPTKARSGGKPRLLDLLWRFVSPRTNLQVSVLAHLIDHQRPALEDRSEKLDPRQAENGSSTKTPAECARQMQANRMDDVVGC